MNRLTLSLFLLLGLVILSTGCVDSLVPETQANAPATLASEADTTTKTTTTTSSLATTVTTPTTAGGSLATQASASQNTPQSELIATSSAIGCDGSIEPVAPTRGFSNDSFTCSGSDLLFAAIEASGRTAIDLGWELTETEMWASTGTECGAFLVSDGWVLLISAFDRERQAEALVQVLELLGGVPLWTCGVAGIGPGVRDLGDRLEADGLCVLRPPTKSEPSLSLSPVALPAFRLRGGSCDVGERSYVLARFANASDAEEWIASDRPSRDCHEIGVVASWLVVGTEAEPGQIDQIVSSLGGTVATACG